jgi:chromosome segregation ATPase
MRDRKAAALTKWRQFVSLEREYEYEERAAVAMNKLQETIGQLRKLESSMQALRAQHLDSESALASNEQALKECIAQYQQASQALSEAEVQRDSAEQQCLRAQSEIESLTEECDELNIELQETKSARQEETNAHTIVMEQLESVIADLKAQCASVQQQCQQLQAERDQLDTELGRVRTMVSTQEQQLQSLMAAHSLNMKEIDVKVCIFIILTVKTLDHHEFGCHSTRKSCQQRPRSCQQPSVHASRCKLRTSN